jgi:hypothetical protein
MRFIKGIFGASFDDSKTPTRTATSATADRRGGGRVNWGDGIGAAVDEDIDEGKLTRRGASALRDPVNTSRMDTSVIYSAAPAVGGSVSKGARSDRTNDQSSAGPAWVARTADVSSSLADANDLYEPVQRTPADKRSWLDEHNPFSEASNALVNLVCASLYIPPSVALTHMYTNN